MMSENEGTINLPHGSFAEIADYRKQQLVDFDNNPLIEALPDILTVEEFIDAVTNYPRFDKSERKLSARLRTHCVMRLMQYFQPTNKHIDVEDKVSHVIRQGYTSRNPLLPEFRKRLREIQRSFNEELEDEKNDLITRINSSNSSISGFSMIGVSGVGKSTALEKILGLYPQVIVHSNYKDTPLNLYQVVHLTLDCPQAGSLRGLCIDFFRKVDNLLGTNYYRKFSQDSKLSEDVMLAEMAQIAYLHCIGVLVIDEIQNLSEAKSGGKEKMLNFFVKLYNTIGVPIVMVGTNKASNILKAELRQGRRATGIGTEYWERFKLGSEKERKLWDFFIEELFDYQWTVNRVKYNNEFSSVIYDESQGIIDIAIKLYMITQWRAIKNGSERITTGLIRQVASDSLQLVRPMLDALRSGNPDRIAKYSDITPININNFYDEYKSKLAIKHGKVIEKYKNKYEKQKSSSLDLTKVLSGLLELEVPHKLAKSCAETVYAEQQNDDTIESLIRKGFVLATEGGADFFTENSEPTPPKKVEKLKKEYISGDLRVIVKHSEKSEISAYQGLKDNGVIKSPLEEFAIA